MTASSRFVRRGASAIQVVNARTHNLRGVTCAVPVGALTVVTGPSGSGKSSLAFDTLYAEGQRRFVESMSTYARQYLERLERPEVDEISHVLPAIAIEQKAPARSARSTIGSATEIHDVLRLLFSAAGTLRCPDDGSLVRRETPQTVRAALLEEVGEGARLLVVAPRKVTSFAAESAEWRRLGFYRYVSATGEVLEISSSGREEEKEEPDVPRASDVKGRRPLRGARSAPLTSAARGKDFLLSAAASAAAAYKKEIPVPFPLLIGRHVLRLDDPEILSSLSMAFDSSDGEVRVLVAGEPLASARTYRRGLSCNACGRAFTDPVPALFSFHSPRGACETCEGFGRIVGIDAARVIPDARKTLRERPIAPFNSPSYESAYDDLKAASRRLGLRWDVPWNELTERERGAVWKGSGEWYGVEGLFRYLEKKRYKVHVRVLLARYRGYTTCPACRGARLRPEALAVTVGGLTIAQVCDLTLDELPGYLASLPLREEERARAASLVEELAGRARTLVEIGLGYLTLARTMRTLSGGEAQRVQLGSAIGNALTGTLYVLDEPTVGLHPRDTHRLLEVLRRLAAAGNAVVAVEHDTDVIRAADHVIDLGPGAGALGGRLVFEGTPEALTEADTATGRSLKKEREIALLSESKPYEPSVSSDAVAAETLGAFGTLLEGGVGPAAPDGAPPRGTPSGRSRALANSPSKKLSSSVLRLSPVESIRVVGARANNLRNLSVSFPLHRLVAVSGVSGSGKSSLVVDVLAAGARQRMGKGLLPGLDAVGAHDAIEGLERVSDVVLVDQSPLGRSSRSNPATVTKAWDEVRALLARTPAARARRLEKGAFSFNAAGGRCERCEGAGVVTVDMQFLADVTTVCDVCDGRRFKAEVLEVRLRGRNVDELLATTVDEARLLFSDAPAIADRLAPLADAGLGYLALGQSTATLSGGEAQRLKIASFLRGAGRPEGAGPVRFRRAHDGPRALGRRGPARGLPPAPRRGPLDRRRGAQRRVSGTLGPPDRARRGRRTRRGTPRLRGDARGARGAGRDAGRGRAQGAGTIWLTVTDEKWRYVLSAEGREIELSDGEVTLGRSRTATVRLEHESVSRSHALLTFDRGEAVVKDLASSNGTFVGGKRIVRETRLVNGDRLQLGAAVVDVRILAPNVPSERTALLRPDELPDAASAQPPAGITYEPVPGLTNPGVAAPAPPPGPDPMSASELFRDVDAAPARDPSIHVDVFPPMGGAPDEVSTIAPPLLPVGAAPSPPAPPPPRELADFSIRLDDADRAGRISVVDRAAAFRDRRAPSLNEGPRNAASPFARLLAALVDAVILAAINVILFAPVFLIDYFRAELQTHDAAPDWAFRAITALSFLLALLANTLYVVGGWAWRGRTPGKSLFGLAVVKRGSTSGRGIGWPSAFVRAIVCVLAGLPLGLGWAWAFFEKERRAFQDLAAGTWVIRVR